MSGNGDPDDKQPDISDNPSRPRTSGRTSEQNSGGGAATTEKSVGKIKFNTKDTIANGSPGTTVFRGMFDDRVRVAVKRVLSEDKKVVKRETDALTKHDVHQNIIRLYDTEDEYPFSFFALELAIGNMTGYVEKSFGGSICDYSENERVGLLKNIMDGIEWLHTKKPLLNRVHRDIKPPNILLCTIGGKTVAKLSDFGLCREVSHEGTIMTKGIGTLGWIAPEIRAGKEADSSVDILPAGCVAYYVMSDGKHPFGDNNSDQQKNIDDGHHELSAKESESMSERMSVNLVENMIQHEPEKRPTATDVLKHPFFWDLTDAHSFITAVSDSAEDNKELQERLKKDEHLVLREDIDTLPSWKANIQELIEADENNPRSTSDRKKKPIVKHKDNVVDLLRFLRNTLSHMEANVDGAYGGIHKIAGKTKEKFFLYMTKKFPSLVLYVWYATYDLRKDEKFKKYYTAEFEFSAFEVKYTSSLGVENIKPTVKEDELRKLFAKHGGTNPNVRMRSERKSCKRCFINFSDVKSARLAMRKLQGHNLQGSKLKISVNVEPKECSFWRKYGCKRDNCAYGHIQANKGIDGSPSDRQHSRPQ